MHCSYYSRLIRLITIASPFWLAVSMAGAQSQRDIGRWIHQLEAPRFEAREAATEQLLEAGPVVIPELVRAMKQSGIETRSRGLDILRELALSDNSTANEAEAAIQSLTESEATSMAHRAKSLLSSLESIRSSRSLALIRRLGATVSTSHPNQMTPAMSSTTELFITLGAGWRGTPDDLQLLRWLPKRRRLHVLLRGERFDDQWLKHVCQVRSLVGLELNRTAVTDEGMEAIHDVKQLAVLDVRYSKNLTNAFLEHLKQLELSLTLRVFGGQVSKEAFDQLSASRPNWSMRHGRGGFLGISGAQNQGAPGCLVMSVTPNHAASIAGLQNFDVITEYDGKRVTQFMPLESNDPENNDDQTSLSELIAQNKPGDVVKVTIRRGRETLVKEVTLGEWP